MQRTNLTVDKIRVGVNRRYQELMQTDGYVTDTNGCKPVFSFFFFFFCCCILSSRHPVNPPFNPNRSLERLVLHLMSIYGTFRLLSSV
ncbi:hypothetical protein ACFX5L_05255 [Bacteroides sp. KG123]|uniref:hypothetical protein n=1 Tax=unclassified Bacteroides TaxID=2646097 RepID=UPI003D7FD0ED